MHNLPFATTAFDMDEAAVNACLTAGMIVVVNVDELSFITGIISAHTSVTEAFNAYQPVEMHNNTAVIIPTENSHVMYYTWLTEDEFKAATRL